MAVRQFRGDVESPDEPRERRLGNLSVGDRSFGLSRDNSILILLLDLLQVLPESIEILAELLNELLPCSSRFLHDRVFPHAISLP